MFNFYPFNFALLFIILIPSVVIKADKEKEEGNNEKIKSHKTLEAIETCSRWGMMVFFAVKYETVKHNSLLSYLLPSLFVFLYIAYWIIVRKKIEKTSLIILSILLSLIFLSSAIIDSNYILLLFTFVYAPIHTYSTILEEKEKKND